MLVAVPVTGVFKPFEYFPRRLIAYLVMRRNEAWHKRLWIVVCAGAIAGESLVGVALSLLKIAGK